MANSKRELAALGVSVALLRGAVLRIGHHGREEGPQAHRALQPDVARLGPCRRALDVLQGIVEVAHAPGEARALVDLADDVQLVPDRRKGLCPSPAGSSRNFLEVARHELVEHLPGERCLSQRAMRYRLLLGAGLVHRLLVAVALQGLAQRQGPCFGRGEEQDAFAGIYFGLDSRAPTSAASTRDSNVFVIGLGRSARRTRTRYCAAPRFSIKAISGPPFSGSTVPNSPKGWRQTTSIYRKSLNIHGGGGRNRTGVHGFAGRCMTTLPPRRLMLEGRALLLLNDTASMSGNPRGASPLFCRTLQKRENGQWPFSPGNLERETRLELATSTLARLRSTN